MESEIKMNEFENFRMTQKAKMLARTQTFQLKQKILRPKVKEAIDLAKIRPLGLIAEFPKDFSLEIPKYIESKENLESLLRKRQHFKMINGKAYVKNPDY